MGLTQKALAERLCALGVEATAQAIYHWEVGDVAVPAAKLPALDKALDLLDGTMYRELNLKKKEDER